MRCLRLAVTLLVALIAGCREKAPPPAVMEPPSLRSAAEGSLSAAVLPSAIASVSPPVAGPKATCPLVLKEKPQAWKARASSAAALAEVGIAWPSPDVDEEGKPLPAWALTSVTMTRAALASAGAEDYWVEARFTQARGVAPKSQGVGSAALIKQADGSYCALAGPSEAQEFLNHVCLGGPDVWPIAFHLLHIVDKDRITIIAEKSSGYCGRCGRSGMDEIALLDVQGFDLATVFQQSIFAASYNGCSLPPERWRASSVEWVGRGMGDPSGAAPAIGGYPRDLLLIDEVECEGQPPGSTVVCTPEAKETRYAFTSGKYAPVGSREVKAPVVWSVPLDEGGADEGKGRVWADRCFKQLKDEKLDAAERLCQHALERASDAEIRGSTYYNLALIAEKKGDLARACAHVKASLAVRPGNAATQAKRGEVCK